MTRNAVLGKLHREGLAGTRPPEKLKPQQRKPPPAPRLRVRKPRLVLVVANPPAPPPAQTQMRWLRLFDLPENYCHFPLGEPRELVFCGADAVPGQSYCPHHLNLCLKRSKTDA